MTDNSLKDGGGNTIASSSAQSMPPPPTTQMHQQRRQGTSQPYTGSSPLPAGRSQSDGHKHGNRQSSAPSNLTPQQLHRHSLSGKTLPGYTPTLQRNSSGVSSNSLSQQTGGNYPASQKHGKQSSFSSKKNNQVGDFENSDGPVPMSNEDHQGDDSMMDVSKKIPHSFAVDV